MHETCCLFIGGCHDNTDKMVFEIPLKKPFFIIVYNNIQKRILRGSVIFVVVKKN